MSDIWRLRESALSPQTRAERSDLLAREARQTRFAPVPATGRQTPTNPVEVQVLSSA
jgi:hypothetical protein